MADSDKLFCSKPFEWFEISRSTEEGQAFLCCPSWLDKPVGNLLRQSVAETWNSPEAADVRRSILDGSFEYCNAARCPYLQTRSGPVQPVSAVSDPLMRKAIDEQLTILPWGPVNVIASYDRSCNLSCPSCRTRLIMENDQEDRILTIQGKLNDEALKEARVLYITGSGDPFGSPYFRKWLQTMKRSDMPRLETIHLHTNGLLWTRRVWETIPPEIRALVRWADISIDAATPATYAVNRRGGEFGRLLENLAFISSELRPAGPLEWLGMSMVVQENNFAEMIPFIEMGKRFRVDTVYFHQLVNWGTFTDQEFADRAIHLPGHPRHREFLEVLRDPVFGDPIVYVANLTTTRQSAQAGP